MSIPSYTEFEIDVFLRTTFEGFEEAAVVRLIVALYFKTGTSTVAAIGAFEMAKSCSVVPPISVPSASLRVIFTHLFAPLTTVPEIFPSSELYESASLVSVLVFESSSSVKTLASIDFTPYFSISAMVKASSTETASPVTAESEIPTVLFAAVMV